MTVSTDPVPAATHLIARQHGGSDLQAYAGESGTCCFCEHEGPGQPAQEAISHDYFSDYDLMTADTGHVCAACAYCMDQRGLKSGHWVATRERYESHSTGDLLDLFGAIRDGAYDAPLAVHVSENPIRSEHAYLWTPVGCTTAPLVVTYARQRVYVRWGTFEALVDAIEELRWHGFRGDDIRHGEPRIRDLGSVGRDRYRELAATIEPHRRSPRLELAWTLSRSKDDQPTAPDSAPA